MKIGDVVMHNKGLNNKKYLVIGIDFIYSVCQMIDNKGNLREDVIDNIDLSKLF